MSVSASLGTAGLTRESEIGATPVYIRRILQQAVITGSVAPALSGSPSSNPALSRATPPSPRFPPSAWDRENAHALSHRPSPGAKLSVRASACVVRARARGPASGTRGPEAAVARRLCALGLLGLTAAPVLFQSAAEATPGTSRCLPFPRVKGCEA